MEDSEDPKKLDFLSESTTDSTKPNQLIDD